MASKRRLRSNTARAAAAASSSEDTFSKFKIEQRPTKDPLSPAPADRGSDGSDGDDERGVIYEIYSSDEIGEDGMIIKRRPPSKRMAAAEVPANNVAAPEGRPLRSKAVKSPPRRKVTRKLPASAAGVAMPPPRTGNEAADQARSPSQEKAAGAADKEAAKSSPPPKKAADLPTNHVASPAASPLKRKAMRKVAASAAEIAMPPPRTGNEAADQRARSPSPEKAAGAADTEAAKSSPSKKAGAAADPPRNNVASPLKMKRDKSPLRKKKMGKVSEPAAEFAMRPLRTRNEAVDQHARSPSPAAKLPATNAAQPNKAAARAEVAGMPPSQEAAASAGADKGLLPLQEEYDREMHFKDKTLMYSYLWQMVLTLEKEYSLPLKGAFLKINDNEASILNTKLKNMRVEEMTERVCWMDIEREVAQVLVNLIK